MADPCNCSGAIVQTLLLAIVVFQAWWNWKLLEKLRRGKKK